MKKMLIWTLTLALLLGLAMPALAASPKLTISESTLHLYYGDTHFVHFKLKNAGSVAIDNASIFKESDPSHVIFDDGVFVTDTTTAEYELTTASKSGKATVTIRISLSNGKTQDFKITIHVADNYAPKLADFSIQTNPETGDPQLKLHMTDDFGLKNVCFVRVWTDESGAEQREIYDIISLYEQTNAYVYRTLNLPGAYSVQVNDYSTPTGRFNSKVLITLLDTDGDGKADTYYTKDSAQTTKYRTAEAN